MKPSIGRTVHYVPVYAPQSGDLEPLPATIIRVKDDEQCTLGVFGLSSYTVYANVPHIEPSEDGYPVAGAWFWPPRS